MILADTTERNGRNSARRDRRSATVSRVGLRGHGIVRLANIGEDSRIPSTLSRTELGHPFPSRYRAGLSTRVGVADYRSGGGDVAPPAIAAVSVFRQFSPCLSRCASNSGLFMIYDPRPSATASLTGPSYRSVRGRANGDRLSHGEHSDIRPRSGDQRVYLAAGDPARGPARRREPECRNAVQLPSGGSDENGTHHRFVTPTTSILIPAGVIWPVVVVEMVTALMMVRPSSPHHVAALLSLRGLT